MDRQQMERCLDRVAAYRASVQTAQAWAQTWAQAWAEANDVPMPAIASCGAHSRRWQTKLENPSTGASTATKSSGFMASRLAPSVASTSVRVELNAGPVRLQPEWPLAHTRELGR